MSISATSPHFETRSYFYRTTLLFNNLTKAIISTRNLNNFEGVVFN